MNNIPSAHRTLFASKSDPHLNGLLQSLLAAELLRPSAELWLVSPWVSDVPLLENAAGQFSHVEPDWPRSRIGLGRLLQHLAGKGTRVYVVTRPLAAGSRWAPADRYNELFLAAMKGARAAGLPLYLVDSELEDLHMKGLLTDYILVSGSMNFTYGGITRNDEKIDLTTEAALVSQARLEFRSRYAGLAGPGEVTT